MTPTAENNQVQWQQQLITYGRLLRLDRPIGFYLLLWPALWALWLAAEGFPDGWVFFVFVSGVLLMRSAGCILNDLADRDFDVHVQRTRERPLATGAVSVREAQALAVLLLLIAFALVLTLNRLTILLSLVAVALAATYPFMKRYTYLPQVHLGLAFGWAVPMAFAAQTGSVPIIAWLILIATVLWAVAYDTMYAMVDRVDDLRIGVKSTAILFGSEDRLIIGFIQLLLIAVLWLIGYRMELGGMYYVGLVAATGFAVYQQYLIRDREPAQCLQAFLNNHWLGLAMFTGILAHFLCVE